MSATITKPEMFLARALGHVEPKRITHHKALDRCLSCAVEVAEGVLYCDECHEALELEGGEELTTPWCCGCGDVEVRDIDELCPGCAQEQAESEWADRENDIPEEERR